MSQIVNDVDSGSDSSECVWHLRQSFQCHTSPSTFADVFGVRSSEHQTSSRALAVSSDVVTESHTDCGQSTAPGIRHSISRFLRSAYVSKTRSTADLPLLQCTVFLLDGQVVVHQLQRGAMGRELFQLLVTQLQLEEPDHFGLAYYHPYSTSVASIATSEIRFLPSAPNDRLQSVARWNKSRTLPPHYRSTIRSCNGIAYPTFVDGPFWLKLDQKIFDQCHSWVCCFNFEVRFYVPHPDRSINCPVTRRQYCLQLRKHLSTGRLHCSFFVHVLLGSFIVQMELGDAHPRYSQCPDPLSVPHSSVTTTCSFSHCPSSAESRSLLSTRTCSLASPEPSDEEMEAVWDSRSAPVSQGVHRIQPLQPSRSTNSSLYPDSESVRQHRYCSILTHLAQQSCTQTSIPSDDEFLVSPGDAQLHVGVNWPYPSPLTRGQEAVILRHTIRAHRKLYGWSYNKAEEHFLRCVGLLPLYGMEMHLLKSCFTRPYNWSWSRFLWPSFQHCSFFDDMTYLWSLGKRCHSFAETEDCHNNSGPASSILSHNHSAKYSYAVGISSAGLFLYWGQIRLRFFSWVHIIKLSMHQSVCNLFTSEEARVAIHRSYSSLMWIFQFSSPAQCSRFYHSFVDHHRHFRTSRDKSIVVGSVSALPAQLSVTPASTDIRRQSIVTSSSSRPRIQPSWLYRNVGRFTCWRLSTRRSRTSTTQEVDDALVSEECDAANMHSACTRNTDNPFLEAVTVSNPLPANSCCTDSIDEQPWIRVSNMTQRNCSTPSEHCDVHLCSSISHPPTASSDLPSLEAPLSASTLCGSLRECHTLDYRETTSNRPCSAAEQEPLCVAPPNADQPPPPRPQLPAPHSQLACSTVMTHNAPINTNAVAGGSTAVWRGPVVPTYTGIFNAQGKLTRLSACGKSQLSSKNAANFSSASTNRTVHQAAVFVVPTKSTRFSATVIPEVNQYLILTTAGIRSIRGCDVPRVATKSIYLRYHTSYDDAVMSS